MVEFNNHHPDSIILNYLGIVYIVQAAILTEVVVRNPGRVQPPISLHMFLKEFSRRKRKTRKR